MIGKNVSRWLAELRSGAPEEKAKAATSLLKASKWYFNDKKVALKERLAIIDDLIPLKDDPERIVRECITYLIGLLQVSNDTVNDFLSKMLADEIPEVQIGAISAGASIGKGSSALVPILIRLSSHPNREIRYRIPWALKEIGWADDSLYEPLVRLSNDDDSTVRMYALDAIPYCIKEIGPGIKEIVQNALGRKDESAGAACRVIQKTETDWSDTRKILLKLVKEDAPDAVLALCLQWPEMADDPVVNNWLKKNSGYWWAEDLLHGKSIEKLRKR